MIDFFIACWFFIFGACIGSFLNVAALRALSGESIVLPPSKCPKCGNKLKWWMNIPIVSYLVLFGRCHFCKCRISIQYPIVEFITGVLFAFSYLAFGLSIQTFFYIIAFALLTVMSITDIKESVIFDIHAYILIMAGLILGALSGEFLFALSGAFIGVLIYELIARSGYLFAGQRAFGEGDSYIAAGIGAFFGWKMMLYSIVLSVLIMAIFTLPYFIIYSYKNGRKMTVSALVLAAFLIILAAAVEKFELIKDFTGAITFLAVIIIGTIWAVKQIISEIKKPDKNGEIALCMLPFGPAMAISFLIIAFFDEKLQTFVQSYLNLFM